MRDVFFLVVGIMLAVTGLILITAKVMTYIKCTEPMDAAVVKLKKESTMHRGTEHIHYRPVVAYSIGGKKFTEEAYFRTRRKTKYPVDSEIKICYNPGNPGEMRFVGHLFPLPMGLAFLFLGAVLIWCFFL